MLRKPFSGGSQVSQNKISTIRNVVFFGASIIAQSFNSAIKMRDAEIELAKNGVDAQVSVESVPGEGIADYLVRIDTVLAKHAGQRGVAIFLHGPGNDVSSSRPFRSATDSQKRAIVDGLRIIADKVEAAGHLFIMSNISRRYYGGGINFPEEEGSLPYNTYLIEPFIKERLPHAWDFISNKPKISMYDIFSDLAHFDIDEIHPNDPGETHVRRKLCKEVANVIGAAPLQFNAPSGSRIVFGFGKATPYSNESINAANTLTSGNAKAKTTWGIGCVVLHTDSTAFNTAGKGNAGDTSASVSNHEVLSQSVFTENPPYPNGGALTITHTISGLANGQTGTVTVSGSRNTTAADRVTEITYSGETKAFNPAADVPEFVSFPFIVTNNQIVLKQGHQVGSIYSYVSGIQLDFD